VQAIHIKRLVGTNLSDLVFKPPAITNEVVEKVVEGSRECSFWGTRTIPENEIVQWRTIVKVDYLSW
jgi:hypothetical protein